MKPILFFLLVVGLAFSANIFPPGGGIQPIQPVIVNFSPYPISEVAQGQVREGTTSDVVGISYSGGTFVLATNSRIDNENINRLYALGINGNRIEEMDSFTLPVAEEAHASSFAAEGDRWSILMYDNAGANRTCTLAYVERSGGQFISAGSQILRTTTNDFWCEDVSPSQSGVFAVGRGFEPDLRGYKPLAADARLHDSTFETTGRFSAVHPLDAAGTRFVAVGELRDANTYKGLIQVYDSDVRGIFPLTTLLVRAHNAETGFTDVAQYGEQRFAVIGAYDTQISGFNQGILRTYTLEDGQLSQSSAFDFETLSSNITIPARVAVGDVDGDTHDEIVVLATTFDFGRYDAELREYVVTKKTLLLLVFDEELSLKGSTTIPLAGNDNAFDLDLLLANVGGDSRPEMIAAWNNNSAQIRVFRAPFVDSIAPVIEVVQPGPDTPVGDTELIVNVQDAGTISRVWVEVGSINKTLQKDADSYSATLTFREARDQTLAIFARDSSGNLGKTVRMLTVVAPEEPPIAQNDSSTPVQDNSSQGNVTPPSSVELDRAISELEIKIDVLRSQEKDATQAQEYLLNAYRAKSQGNVDLALAEARSGISAADAVLAAQAPVQSQPPDVLPSPDPLPLYAAGILVIVVVAGLGYLLIRKK